MFLKKIGGATMDPKVLERVSGRFLGFEKHYYTLITFSLSPIV